MHHPSPYGGHGGHSSGGGGGHGHHRGLSSNSFGSFGFPLSPNPQSPNPNTLASPYGNSTMAAQAYGRPAHSRGPSFSMNNPTLANATNTNNNNNNNGNPNPNGNGNPNSSQDLRELPSSQLSSLSFHQLSQLQQQLAQLQQQLNDEKGANPAAAAAAAVKREPTAHNSYNSYPYRTTNNTSNNNSANASIVSPTSASSNFHSPITSPNNMLHTQPPPPASMPTHSSYNFVPPPPPPAITPFTNSSAPFATAATAASFSSASGVAMGLPSFAATSPTAAAAASGIPTAAQAVNVVMQQVPKRRGRGAAATMVASLSPESIPPQVTLKLKRKLRKNNREKQRRTEINEQFDQLCEMLQLTGGSKVEKFTILHEAIAHINFLREQREKWIHTKQSLRHKVNKVMDNTPSHFTPLFTEILEVLTAPEDQHVVKPQLPPSTIEKLRNQGKKHPEDGDGGDDQDDSDDSDQDDQDDDDQDERKSTVTSVSHTSNSNNNHNSNNASNTGKATGRGVRRGRQMLSSVVDSEGPEEEEDENTNMTSSKSSKKKGQDKYNSGSNSKRGKIEKVHTNPNLMTNNNAANNNNNISNNNNNNNNNNSTNMISSQGGFAQLDMNSSNSNAFNNYNTNNVDNANPASLTTGHRQSPPSSSHSNQPSFPTSSLPNGPTSSPPPSSTPSLHDIMSGGRHSRTPSQRLAPVSPSNITDPRARRAHSRSISSSNLLAFLNAASTRHPSSGGHSRKTSFGDIHSAGVGTRPSHQRKHTRSHSALDSPKENNKISEEFDFGNRATGHLSGRNSQNGSRPASSASMLNAPPAPFIPGVNNSSSNNSHHQRDRSWGIGLLGSTLGLSSSTTAGSTSSVGASGSNPLFSPSSSHGHGRSHSISRSPLSFMGGGHNRNLSNLSLGMGLNFLNNASNAAGTSATTGAGPNYDHEAVDPALQGEMNMFTNAAMEDVLHLENFQ